MPEGPDQHSKDKDMHDNKHAIGSKLTAILFALLVSSTVLLSAIGPAGAASISHQHIACGGFQPGLA
jgi:hypothetical protein